MDEELLGAFRKGLREAKQQQKTDDMISWIGKHWRLFCYSRQRFLSIKEELEQRSDLNVTSLLDALGVDPCVVFKKVKVADTASLLMNPGRSELMQTFSGAVDARRKPGKSEPMLCMLAVAGEHTIAVTNMDVRKVPGHSSTVVDGTEGRCDVTAFSAEDIAQRLPNLFHER